MEECWPYSAGIVYRRGLRPSAHFLRVKATRYVLTKDTEIMSFNYFFISFRLK